MKFNSLSVKLKDHATIFISKHSENYIVVFKIVILIDFRSFEAFHILRFKNKLKKMSKFNNKFTRRKPGNYLGTVLCFFDF